MFAEKLAPAEFKERYRLMREVDRAEWSAHWPAIVASALFELLGGFFFGACLGLAFSLWVLTYFLKNY